PGGRHGHRRHRGRISTRVLAGGRAATSGALGRPHRRSDHGRTLRVPVQLTSRRIDVLIAAALFCAATWVGVRAVDGFRAVGGVQDFYQRRFGPSVLLACGRAFEEPILSSAPSLEAFLAERADSFDCRQLPASLATGPLDAFQRTARYL